MDIGVLEDWVPSVWVIALSKRKLSATPTLGRVVAVETHKSSRFGEHSSVKLLLVTDIRRAASQTHLSEPAR